jgi:hypothetical protein
VICTIKVKVNLTPSTPGRYNGRKCTPLLVINICTGWRWVISLTPLSPNLWGTSKCTHWIGGLGGAPEPVWTFWRRERCLSRAGIQIALLRIPLPANSDTNAYLNCVVTRKGDISLMQRLRKALFLSTFLFLTSFFAHRHPCFPSQLIHNQASDTASPPRVAVAFNPSSTPLHFHQQPPQS